MQTSTGREHYVSLPLDQLQECFDDFNELAEEAKRDMKTT